MTDHLFPESTTYIHSYPGHKGFHAKETYHGAGSLPYLYEEPVKKPGQDRVLAIGSEGLTQATETSCCIGEEQKPKNPNPACSTLGFVELSELKPADRAFFLAQTYRTTYGDYAKDEPSSTLASLAAKNPFSRRDDVMLQILNATKPNVAHYGFGLPNKCCVAWSNAQSRTLPNENRTCFPEKKRLENPYPGYPDKMYPYILNKELCPHYDGSFVFGYTGHQRRFLDYPDDVSAILRRDFPQYVPKALTINQAKLTHLPIPMCQNRNNPTKEAGQLQ